MDGTGAPPRPGEAGFSGFERKSTENTLEYELILLSNRASRTVVTALASLEDVRKAAVRLSDDLTKDYIWQRGHFSLEAKNDKGLVYLHGTTDYGDCVEDEWLIVYILRELSKSFSNLWVRVCDSDGEFLLIEAANVLPKWLTPEMDSHRVWIRNGELLIIPVGGAAKGPLSLLEAVKILESGTDLPIHSAFIEAEAFYRLEKYPQQISNSLHYSCVTIPRKLAYILHDRPKAIAPATEAFYLRDLVSLKALQSDLSTLVFPPNDLVTISVKFTKVLYAQLYSQRFEPPPAWGAAIRSAEGEATAQGSDAARQKLSRLVMGMKLTSGFEMLAKSAHQSDSRVAREVAFILDDLAEDGDSVLPTDETIAAWKDVGREDDDSWLDINYEDFEKELGGRHGRGARAGDDKAAFGDANTQADLRKMVSRFEAFLNDENAGLDGAEVDDMDEDDDNDDDDELESSDEGSEDEDREVSFDEEQFANMMREMMGLPPDAGRSQPSAGSANTRGKAPETKTGSERDVDGIQELAAQMEAELNQHGALDLDPGRKKLAVLTGSGSNSAEQRLDSKEDDREDADEDEGEDEEINIDYNLARNLLESFKGQAGMAGPAGNLLSMMGMHLPRDEGDDDGDDAEGSKS